MLKGHHLPHRGEPNERRTFPTDVIAFDEIEAAGRQNEKSAIDQAAVAAGLLDEGGDRVALTLEGPVTPGGRTAVTVASLPWLRWNSMDERMSNCSAHRRR